MTRPVIGIVPLWDDEKQSLWMLPGYPRWIEATGGLPVILPLTGDADLLRQAARLCDGLLFTGGHDLSPALYDQQPVAQCGALCPHRDTMETFLFREIVLGKQLPALGICRGIQLFNALLGGTLWQDIPSQLSSDICHNQQASSQEPAHEVTLLPAMPLRELLGRETLPVNSYHHQGIDKLSPRLSAMAVAPDSMIEAVRMPEHPFVWAVQWHPESYDDSEASRLLFSSFIKACNG